jgi:hypothetical protein
MKLQVSTVAGSTQVHIDTTTHLPHTDLPHSNSPRCLQVAPGRSASGSQKSHYDFEIKRAPVAPVSKNWKTLQKHMRAGSIVMAPTAP